MQSIIIFTLCVFVIILSVQARSIDIIHSGVETEMSKKDNFNERYSRLLAYLKNQKPNTYNNNNDDSASTSSEDIKQLPKRGFFLFPDRRSSQRHRQPTYSYGRKSHWDTFFG